MKNKLRYMLTHIRSFFEYVLLRFWLTCTLGFLFWLVFSGTVIEVIGVINERFYNDFNFIPVWAFIILVVIFLLSLYSYMCKSNEKKE